jgi:hypothetical protein
MVATRYRPMASRTLRAVSAHFTPAAAVYPAQENLLAAGQRQAARSMTMTARDNTIIAVMRPPLPSRDGWLWP